MKEALLDHLLSYVSDHKIELFGNIIRNRTRHITVAVENIYQPHNASAVLRSCDCFGVQDVHIIENSNKYEVNPDVALGASKWLTLHKYSGKENNSLDCISGLKKAGYKVLATTPHTDSQTIFNYPVDQKIALLFGTEGDGLSEVALEHADDHIKIPMYGFTESFNISVSAAICLSHLTQRMRESNTNWRLTKEEEIAIKLDWARQAVKSSDMIEKAFLKSQPE